MNESRLQKDLTNAKARFKAAQKRMAKLENSGDNQAIAEAQTKLDKEQEIIDSIEKQLATAETIDYDEPKSIKEVIALVNIQEPDYENARSNKRKSKDNPQVSFRTDEVIYQGRIWHLDESMPIYFDIKAWISHYEPANTISEAVEKIASTVS